MLDVDRLTQSRATGLGAAPDAQQRAERSPAGRTGCAEPWGSEQREMWLSLLSVCMQKVQFFKAQHAPEPSAWVSLSPSISRNGYMAICWTQRTAALFAQINFL